MAIVFNLGDIVQHVIVEDLRHGIVSGMLYRWDLPPYYEVIWAQFDSYSYYTHQELKLKRKRSK
jgi:hypothetical protein